jgi:hypothetical protein
LSELVRPNFKIRFQTSKSNFKLDLSPNYTIYPRTYPPHPFPLPLLQQKMIFLKHHFQLFSLNLTPFSKPIEQNFIIFQEKLKKNCRSVDLVDFFEGKFYFSIFIQILEIC